MPARRTINALAPSPNGGTRARRAPDLTAEAVRAHALEAFGSAEKAAHWLRRPNHLFGGRSPSQVLRTDPAAVEAEILRIEHGVYV